MKLNFLLNHEDTQYSLANNLTDLTAVQTHFLYICAKMKDDMLNDIQGGAGNNDAQTRTPLDITASDSREDIESKFDVITEYLCQ